MDKLDQYDSIIRKVLTPYENITYANANIHNHAAFDKDNHQYLIISEGWDYNKHLHSCLIHIEIINHKIWIQCDNTEDGITSELLAAGIPQEDIVLGFQEPQIRQYTGFAVT